MRDSQEVVTFEQISKTENSFQVLRRASVRPPSSILDTETEHSSNTGNTSNLTQKTLHTGF